MTNSNAELHERAMTAAIEAWRNRDYLRSLETALEHAIDAYRAIAQQGPVSVVVKPLGWVTTHETLQSANTIVGWYIIDRRLPLGWYWKHSGGYLAGPLGTEDEAKAAAKADYEERILSALASPPPPAQADDNALIRELVAALVKAERVINHDTPPKVRIDNVWVEVRAALDSAKAAGYSNEGKDNG